LEFRFESSMFCHLWIPLSGLYVVDQKLSSFWGPLQNRAVRISWTGSLLRDDLQPVFSYSLLYSSEILRLQDSHSAIGKCDAENATKEPEGETFNEQLSRNPHPPGAYHLKLGRTRKANLSMLGATRWNRRCIFLACASVLTDTFFSALGLGCGGYHSSVSV